ncbi:MAG TPA: ABC transporter ATP-binding protein [Rhizomicrobium sp.]|nr:ABC transporter ATP-binding protein [Rhizomicrobium sp.]
MAGRRTSIEVSKLSKRYELGKRRDLTTFREQLMRLVQPRGKESDRELWALKDVSFSLNEGEVVGIIGRNGAGKSTLLKILSRITFPTSGRIRVRGRVASLLEVGVGFHHELTGRENVYLNGSIMGLRKREVDERFAAIVEFAGVEQFIDTQVKHYSSGMRLRLGFAVAAHLDPDVLIVDEVLAVGDAGFQKKCLAAIEGLHGGGRTVLFVSHNMAAVENLCSRAIWIDGGKIRQDGPAKDVIGEYMASFSAGEGAGADLSNLESRTGTGDARFTRIEYLAPDGTPSPIARSGDPLVIRLHYYANTAIHNPSFGFRLYTAMGTLVTESGHLLHGIPIVRLDPGHGHIDIDIESLNLLPDRYHLSLWITDPSGQAIYDGDVRSVLEIEAADVYKSGKLPNSRQGIVYFPLRWKVSAPPTVRETAA